MGIDKKKKKTFVYYLNLLKIWCYLLLTKKKYLS